jgi:hypothetical protein
VEVLDVLEDVEELVVVEEVVEVDPPPETGSPSEAQVRMYTVPVSCLVVQPERDSLDLRSLRSFACSLSSK